MASYCKAELEKRDIRGTLVVHHGSSCSCLFGAAVQERQGPPGQGNGLQPFHHYSTDHCGYLSCGLFPGQVV